MFCICIQCHPRLSNYLVYLPVQGELLCIQCWAQGWDSGINFFKKELLVYLDFWLCWVFAAARGDWERL